MTDDAKEWTTLRVPVDAVEQAREQKEANGRTWGQQIVRPDTDRVTTTGDDPLAMYEDFREVIEQAIHEATDADGMESALETIEERTGRIERQLEDLGR